MKKIRFKVILIVLVTLTKIPPFWLVIVALATVQIIFGANYVVSKSILGHFPPLVWAVIRMILAAVIMGTILVMTRLKKHPSDGMKYFGPLAIYSIFGIILNQSFFLMGLKRTTATNSAIINVLTPVFTMLLVTISGKEAKSASSLRRNFGFLIALSGVLAVRKIEDFKFSDATFLGDVLTILNCLCFAIFLTTSKKFMEAHDRLWTTFYLFVFAVFGIGLMSINEWSGFVMPEMTTPLLWSMVFAVIGATIMTYFLNVWTLAHANPTHVALGMYIQPIVAAILASIVFDEKISFRTTVASGMIFIGLFLVIIGPSGANKK
ncbi:MAG: DMT family transporter [Xanthomonadaceae bacterium]|nr:DMT family transporter [Xanthomonadaceae bacterium]